MADTKETRSGHKRFQDLFYRDKIFPDAKALLQYKQKAIEEIKSSCLVGVDANILLLPYQLNQGRWRGSAITATRYIDGSLRWVLLGPAWR